MSPSESSGQRISLSYPGVDGAAIYRARGGRQIRAAAFLGIAGLAVALPRLAPLLQGGVTDIGALVVPALGLLAVLAGLVLLAGVLRGLPRVTATHSGIACQTVFGTRSARWAEISPFRLTTLPAGYRSRRATLGIATRIAGRGTLTITDTYGVPLAAMLDALNMRRAQAVGSSPWEAPGPAEPGMDYGVAGFVMPWLTGTILAVLAAVFVAEQMLPVVPPDAPLQPGVTTLLALGGLNRARVLADGEWYRLLTAPLLHASMEHILFNGIALLLAGLTLERLIGRSWLFVTFFFGALGGSVGSLVFNPAGMTSVGASGAIMGLFAALLVCSFRWPAHDGRRLRTQFLSLRILIPSLVPLVQGAGGRGGGIVVDVGAHVGGAIAGAAVGLVLLRFWPAGSALPRTGRVAHWGAALAMLLFAASVTADEARIAPRRIVALIPPAELPKTEAELAARVDELLRRYPDDPRSHMFHAIGLSEAGEAARAELEFRAAIRDTEAQPDVFTARFANALHAELALELIAEDRTAEARDAARPACRAAPADQPQATLRRALADHRLCGSP